MKLIIGAGGRLKQGFTTHDVQPLEGIDIVCEFYELPKHVDTGSCEEIHMTHVLEHFPIAEVQKVLTLVRSLLSDGGRLYIEVPNLFWHSQMLAANPRDRQVVEYAYGGQHDKWDFHYNGFTPEILEEDLMKAGFTVQSLEPNSSIECWVEK